MAFSAVTHRGSANEKVSDTSLAGSPSAAITVGKIAFVFASVDNTTTTTGVSTDLSLADTDGHTWNKVYERTFSPGGVAADGVTSALWWTKVTSEIGTGDSITLTLASAATAKVIRFFEVSITASTIAIPSSGTPTDIDEGAINASALSTSGLTSKEYLHIHARGFETGSQTFTPDSDYTEIDNTAVTSGGATDTNQAAYVEYRIATLTGDTNTGTHGASRDSVDALIAFEEVTAGAQTLDGVLFSSTPTFPTGVISGTSQSLSGAEFLVAPTFFVGAIQSTVTQTLDGVLFTKAPTFFTGSLLETDRTLSGTTFVSAPAFFVGLFAGPGTVPTAAPSAPTVTDEGLRFEVWSLPQLGTFTRKYDLTRWVNSFTVSDKYGEISDGKLTIDESLPAAKLDQLIKVDRANHANDEGSVIRVLRGTTPIIHYVTKQYDDSWSSDDPTANLSLEGMELLLDRAIVPRHDYPALPSVEPDWIYGALSILGNTDLDVSASTSEVATLEINATGGTFKIGISYPAGSPYVYTDDIPFNATAQNVADEIEETGVLPDVLVSGGGTPENPFLIELLDPAGEDVEFVTDSGLLTGIASIGVLTPGGNLATDPWTRSLNPTSGVFHGAYEVFEISTEQFRSAPYSLKIDGEAPATSGAFPGAQQLISVTPGRTYRAAVWVYPTSQAAFRFVIRTRDETYIASESTVLTANSWQEIRIPVVTIPEHVNQIIFRIATISDTDEPAWYVDDALLAPGGEAATYGAIITDILTPIQANGVLTWLVTTWSDTHDSSGTPWDRELEWSVKRGQTMLQLVEHGRKWNYESRIVWDSATSQFKWNLYNPNTGGTDHTGSGLGITGRGISSSGLIARRFPEASYYQAEGDGGQWGEHSDATLEGAWGRLEQYLANNQAIDADSLEDMAERLVNESRDRTDGLSIRLQVPTVMPWAKFQPGDKLKVNLEPQREAEVLRCMAVVASQGPNDSVPAYDVHFGSIVYKGEAATLQAVRVLWRERKGLQTAPAVSQNPGIVAVGTGTFSVFSLPGQAFVEVGRLKLLFPLPVTVIGVSIAVGPVAPTGASIIVDVNKNGVSIFTAGTRPTIPAGSFTSTEAVPTTTAVGAGEWLTVDVDQVGSTLPGGDLTVMVRWIWSVTTI